MIVSSEDYKRIRLIIEVRFLIYYLEFERKRELESEMFIMKPILSRHYFLETILFIYITNNFLKM